MNHLALSNPPCLFGKVFRILNRTVVLTECDRSLVWLGHQPATILDSFKQFCLVDLQRSEGTTMNNIYEVNRFLKYLSEIGKTYGRVATEDIRSYLVKFTKGYSPNTILMC